MDISRSIITRCCVLYTAICAWLASSLSEVNMKRLSRQSKKHLKTSSGLGTCLPQPLLGHEVAIDVGDLVASERLALRASLQPTRKGVLHVATERERIAMYRNSLTMRADFDHQDHASRTAKGVVWLEHFRQTYCRTEEEND